MTDYAAITALGLTAIIQIVSCAYVYGKLSQKTHEHGEQLGRLWGRVDGNTRDLVQSREAIADHERRITRLER